MDRNGVHTMWKEVGQTMGELPARFKAEQLISDDVSVTYAGRLDPLAEGVVILLVGDAVHRKAEFLCLDKEYEFECLWGFETDTYDVLGKVLNVSVLNLDKAEIEKVSKTFIGQRMQIFPAYSSRRVNGKPMFEWAREGKLDEIEIPTKEIEVYSLEVVSQKYILGSELLQSFTERITKVRGDFRQEEILKLWKQTLKPLHDRQFLMTKMKAQVSTGTYIRSLAHEMGKKLGSGALAYAIVRVSVGDLRNT